MQQIGKFILLSPLEFQNWLNGLTVSRIIKNIQVHHTWAPSYKHFKGNNHFALMQSMEASHLARGFAEIAQNATTFPDGTIGICRSFDKVPAGIKGANEHGICIEHVGNFDTGGDVMTTEHHDTIIKLYALLCKKFNLEPDVNSIVYHHWYDLVTGKRTSDSLNTKTCPGTNFFGGNTESSAEKNFIPLIKAEIQKLSGSVGDVAVNTNLPQARVRVALLNVRTGPGKNHPAVSQLVHGTEIAIYEQQDGWYRINSQKNWVKKDFVDLV